MAYPDAGSTVGQSINGNVQRVAAAGGNINETHFHHHFGLNKSDTDQTQETSGSLEIRSIGVKITGLNSWHTAMIIGGGVALGGVAIGGCAYFGCELLNLIREVVAVFGSLVVQASCGSLELLIFTKDKKSKQNFMNDLLSNRITDKIKDIVGDIQESIRVEVISIGAVIATNEEFLKLQKHLKAKQKKMLWKIDNDCKSSLIDMCCTLPIFQNTSRIIVEYVSAEDAADYLKCVMQNCEFYVSPTKFPHLNKQGFLSKHRNFADFLKTQQSQPDLQNKVIRIVKSLNDDETISSKLWDISDLLTVNPRHFPGDCDWVLRNLSKITKSLVFAKEFEIAKDLLVWMTSMLNNFSHGKKISWFWFLLKLANWFVFSFRVNYNYRRELHDEICSQACAIVELDCYYLPLFLPSQYVDCENLTYFITILLKQKSKPALALATNLAKQLILKRDFWLQPWHHYTYVSSGISNFFDALQQSLHILRNKQLKFVVHGLSSIIPKNLFLAIKLDIFEDLLYALNEGGSFLKFPLENVFSRKRSFFHIVNALLNCSEQSYKSSLENYSFSHNLSRQKCVSNLNIILYKIVYLINNQWQPQGVSAVELSEIILRAHFSSNSLQTRDVTLKKFYYDAIGLFKDAEIASSPDSCIEIYDHAKIVFNYPRSTSEFVKIHDLLKMLSRCKIFPAQIRDLRFKIQALIYRVKAASNPIIEFSQQLVMLIVKLNASKNKKGHEFLKLGLTHKWLESIFTAEVPTLRPATRQDLLAH